MKKLLLTFAFLASAATTIAGTEMRLWHSYTHLPDKIFRYSFILEDSKRGLFWGSCGPSTYSIRWMYWIDLIGTGPIYTPEKIKFRKDMPGGGSEDHVPAAGEIRFEAEKKRVYIQMKIEEHGVVRDFEGNGVYKINEKP